MSSNLEQVRAFPRVGYKNSAEKVSRMWRHIFGEGKWSVDNILVQKIDVIAFRVGWVVVEWQIASEHSILNANVSHMAKPSTEHERSVIPR
jgi:hypothetical protein